MQDSLSALLDHLAIQLARLEVDTATRRRIAAGLRAAQQLDPSARRVAQATVLAAVAITERVRLKDQRPRRFTDGELVAAVAVCSSLAEVARRLRVAPSSVTRRVRKLRFKAMAPELQDTVQDLSNEEIEC